MSRRQVLVQLDDDLVEQLDAVSARWGVSRSELIRRGARAVLEADQLGEADRRLVEAYRQQPPDGALLESARRLGAATAPPW